MQANEQTTRTVLEIVDYANESVLTLSEAEQRREQRMADLREHMELCGAQS